MPNLYDSDGNWTVQISPEVAKARFLELYMLTAHIHKTCGILGLKPRNVYYWKATDPEFEENMKMAQQVALTVLEDEATRRAVYGVAKPVYQQGRLVGYVQEYSDTLLVTLLKANAPHKYKERFSGELTGADGKPLVPEAKIIHVHSQVPLANTEDAIIIESNSRPPNEIYELPSRVVPKEEEDFDDLIG